ncbi:MAG: twin-arginine translocase TatA/TatE family subunit [Acidimicrobiales bacterium]
MVVANIFSPEFIVVLVIALVLILGGGSQLPKMARNLGSAGKEFKKAQAEAEEQAVAKERAKAAGAPPAVTSGSDDDKVTLSKAELDALLAEREERAKRQASGPLS